MLTSFMCGAVGAAICMVIALLVMVGTNHVGSLSAPEWLLGGAIVAGTSALVGGLAIICYLFQPRDRWGRRKPVDPTDVLPFL